jgi:hypothetical protein
MKGSLVPGCGIGLAMAMFFGVLGWRCCNKVKYIGEKKVQGSIREGCDSIHLEIFVIRLWLVRYGSNISPRWMEASLDKQSYV